MQTATKNMIDKTKFLIAGQQKSYGPLFVPTQNNFALDVEPRVEYIWATDPSLIKQYAKIIDESFDSELNLNDIYKTISTSDFRSHYRLILNRDEVVGGFRVVFNDPLNEFSLPSERPEFKFKDLFPELNLESNNYCEVSRFAILPRFRRNNQHYVDAFSSTKELMVRNNIKYKFICGSRSRLRLYNREDKNYLKILDIRFLDVSKWSKYQNLEFYVCAYENPDV